MFKLDIFKFFWRLFCIFVGALSCVALAINGFHIEVGPVLHYIVSTEETILEQSFGDLGQYVVQKLHLLSAYFHWGWNLHLDPRWKHLMVILWLYFKQDVEQINGLADEEFKSGNLHYAIKLRSAAKFSRITGILVAVLSSFCAGIVGSTSGTYASNVLFGSLPILGFFGYASAMAWANAFYMREGIAAYRKIPVPPFWKWFGQRVGMGLARSLAGFAVLAIGLLWPVTENPAIFMLIIVWILLAIEWLRRGWPQAKNVAQNKNISMIEAMTKTGNINLGLNMLATISTAFIGIILKY